MRGFLLLALLLIGPVVGQEPTPPPGVPITVTSTEQVPLGDPLRISVTTTGTGLLVRVRQILPGEDLDVSANLLDLEGEGEYAFTNRSPGGYLIEAQAVVDDAIVSAYAYSRIGPVQPTPDPEPDPDPTPDPTPGPKQILVIHETGELTPAMSSLIVQLRTGANQKYLADNKHRLWILDDDLDPRWLAILGDTKLPAIIISDPSRGAAGAVVSQLPTTADAVMELIKKHD